MRFDGRGAEELDGQRRAEDVDGSGVCDEARQLKAGAQCTRSGSLLAVDASFGLILTSSMPSRSRSVFCTPGMTSVKRFLVCG